MDKLFSHIEYDSNHGMDLGIWPRFYLQIQDLAEFSSKSFDSNGLYEKEVISGIKNLYDIHFLIQNLIQDYSTGLKDGRYYYKTSQGMHAIQTHQEREISNKIEDFLSRGKVLLIRLGDCGIIDKSDFNITDFVKVNDSNFEKAKDKYLLKTDKRYLPIINLINKSRNSFLNEFKYLREEAQHEFFKLDRFKIQTVNDQIVVEEPIFKGLPLSTKISFYYENILDFIEKVLVYYFGINGELHLKGFAYLEFNPDYNYSKQHYKYTFALGGSSWSENAERCTYD